MQKPLCFVITMLLLANGRIAYSQNIRNRVGGASAANHAAEANTATVDDMVRIAPNMAFAPEIRSAVSQDSSDNDIAEISRINDEMAKELSELKDAVAAIEGETAASSINTAPDVSTSSKPAAAPNPARRTARAQEDDKTAARTPIRRQTRVAQDRRSRAKALEPAETAKALTPDEMAFDIVDIADIRAPTAAQIAAAPILASPTGKTSAESAPETKDITQASIQAPSKAAAPEPKSIFSPEIAGAPPLNEVTTTAIANASASKTNAGDDTDPYGVIMRSIPHERPASSPMMNFVRSEDAVLAQTDAGAGSTRVSPFAKSFSAIKPDTRIRNTAEGRSPASSGANPSSGQNSSTGANGRRNSGAANQGGQNRQRARSRPVATTSDLRRELRSAYNIAGNRYLSAAEDLDEWDSWDEDWSEDSQDSGYSETSEPVQIAAAAPSSVPAALPTKSAATKTAPGPSPFDGIASEDGKRRTGRIVDLPPGPLRVGAREVLQMKIEFNPNDDAISSESVNIIRSFAQIVTDSPTQNIEIGISERAMGDDSTKKLTARRMAIVANILRHAGVADRQIAPVLTSRDIDSFSFRAVSGDRFENIVTRRGEADAFGEGEVVQSNSVMSW